MVPATTPGQDATEAPSNMHGHPPADMLGVTSMLWVGAGWCNPLLHFPTLGYYHLGDSCPVLVSTESSSFLMI